MSDAVLSDFSAVARLLEKEMAQGIESGVQLSIAHAGSHHDIAVGDNGLGAPLTDQTCVPWTCSSKPIGALAFARAWERGLLRLDDPVAAYLTEYGAAGKEEVRLRDLLTHTTGVDDPIMNLDLGGGELPPWSEIDPLIWSVICATQPRHRPGTTMSYNALCNWFTLDRVITTVEGTKPGDSYRSMFTLLGLSATLGVDPAVPPDRQVELHAAPSEQEGLARLRIAADLPIPGTGVWGTMHDLRLLGQLLLTGRRGDQAVVAAATIEAMASTHWPGQPGKLSTTSFPYGLGFMTLPQLFGRECSFRTYGHAGGNNSTLLVDPAVDLVIAAFWNGRLGDAQTITRRLKLTRAIFADLGIESLARR